MNGFGAFLSAVLAQNAVLVGMLGLDLFARTTEKTARALWASLVLGVSAVASAALSWLLERFVLAPAGLESLRLVAFAAVMVLVSAAASALVRRWLPALAKELGVYVPLVTLNTAVLGTVLRAAGGAYGLGTCVLYALGTAVGFLLISLVFSGLRERLAYAESPKAFRGLPLLLVTAALLYLSFMGFVGMSF